MTFGPCLAGDHCRAYDRVTGTAEDADRHTLGPACLRVAEFATRALPADWVDLEQLLPKPLGVWSDGQPVGKAGPPLPLNLGAEAMQRAIWWVLTTWEDVARDMDRLSDAPRVGVREGPAVARAALLLAPRLGALSDMPAQTLQDYPLAEDDQAQQLGASTYTDRPGWQGVLDLVTLHRRAMAMLGQTAPVRRLPGTCEGCGWDELRQDQPRFRGDEQPVFCRNCALTMTYDDYRHQMGAWAA